MRCDHAIRNRRRDHPLAGGSALRPGAVRRGGAGRQSCGQVGGVTSAAPAEVAECTVTEQQRALAALQQAALVELVRIAEQQIEREAA